MGHDRWIETLSRLFDGDLTGKEKEAAEAHLASCAECRVMVSTWEAARLALAPLKRLEPTPFLETRVMALVASEGALTRNRGWVWFSLPLAGTLAAMILFAGAFRMPDPAWFDGDQALTTLENNQWNAGAGVQVASIPSEVAP